MNVKQQLKEGLLTQNPVTVQLLGMCSTMAITTSLFNGIGMGLSVLVILTLANIFISVLRNVIPNKIRIACFIVVIATFVTMVDLFLKAYLEDLSASLGVFIPLIVVNCIILGRAEAFASKETPAYAALDGLSMGLGFTAALSIMGFIRELLGSGSFLGHQILPFKIILIAAPCGGFLVLGSLVALVQYLRGRPPKPSKTEAAEEAPVEAAVKGGDAQ